MPPIRKGDGTAVAPKGISQVRTGDGRILFDGVAIPDIQDAYAGYIASAGVLDGQGDPVSDGETVSEWQDDTDNNRHLTGGDPTLSEDAVNAEPAIDFVDDSLTVQLSAIEQPNTVFLVVRNRDAEATADAFTAEVGNQHQIQARDGDWNLQNDLSGASISNNYQILTCVFNTDNSKIRVDQSETTGSIADEDLNGINIGGGLDGLVPECWVFPDERSNEQIIDFESYLDDKYDIFD